MHDPLADGRHLYRPPCLYREHAMNGWYFAATDCRLRYGDDRVAAVGITHEVAGPLRLCERGLHASARALDALNLGAGPVVFRVTLSGDVVHGSDKSAATHRAYTAGGIDVSGTLREFACCVAEAAMLLTGHNDPRSWQAIEAARAYVRGEIDTQTLDAAWDAARAAAWAAAGDAARAAAWAAAWAAAGDAAGAAAGDAAGAAAWAAAWAAAGDAAGDAAGAAAGDAAGAAAGAEINDLLEHMLDEAIKGAA
jgi:hypothetical protein